MSQNHGFGSPLGTRSKQNNSLFVAAFFMRDALNFIAQISVDFIPQADFFTQIFKVNNLKTGLFKRFRNIFHFGVFNKQTRGDNFFNHGGFAHRNHVGGADRKIKHYRHAFIGAEPEESANRGD